MRLRHNFVVLVLFAFAFLSAEPDVYIAAGLVVFAIGAYKTDDEKPV